MVTRRRFGSGSSFEELASYSRAVLDSDGWMHVSGTTGFDYSDMTIADDVVAQTHQALRNIESALAQGGLSPADVVRVHYLLTDAADFATIAPVCGRFFATARPAATAMVVGLVDPRMKIEIEVTARAAAVPR